MIGQIGRRTPIPRLSTGLALLALGVAGCVSNGFEGARTTPSPPGTPPAASSATSADASGEGCSPFTLATQLPEEPSSAPVYWQLPYRAPLAEEAAQRVADQLGVAGDVTSYIGEGGDRVFVFSDGVREIAVRSENPLDFTYGYASRPLSEASIILYSFEERSQVAEEFLQSHRLLDFDFEVQPAAGTNEADYSVRVSRLLSGFELFENDPRNPRIWLVLDEDAEVWLLIYQTLNFEAIGEVDVREASEAWAAICHGEVEPGTLYSVYDGTGLLVSTQGLVPVPGSEPLDASYSFAEGQVEAVELVYYAFDFRLMSINAIDSEASVRLVQPVWRFAGHAVDGQPFEILVPAAALEALEAIYRDRPEP